MNERCIAWYLALGQSSQRNTCMIFVLRASAFNSTTTFRPPSCLACVHKQAGIGKEVIGILLQVTGTKALIYDLMTHVQRVIAVHLADAPKGAINRLSKLLASTFLLNLLCLLCRWKSTRRSEQCWLVRRGRPLLVSWDQRTQIRCGVALGFDPPCWGSTTMQETSRCELETIFKILGYWVLIATKLGDFKEVIVQRILLREVRAVTYLAACIVI